MNAQIWRLLGLLSLISINTSLSIDADCDFKQTLEPGKIYYITNPGYPGRYSGVIACRWHAQSNTKIKLTCSKFNIPSSQNCALDTFNVYTDSVTGPQRYCGKGEFTKESTGQEMIITLTTTDNTPGGTFQCYLQAASEEIECKCGWINPMKIVGGEETGINEYPMMAGIIDVPKKQVFCGGTIISNSHIISAAHCLINFKSSRDLGILIGDHDLSTGLDTNATKLYRVERFLIHPSYVVYQRDYDIAIIYIAGIITFTNRVGPACLPFQHYLDSFGGSYVDVLGWGTTEYAGTPSQILYKVSVSVTNFLSCKKFYPELEYRQICTFTEGKDACQFDSGGPVLWINPSTRRLTLVGIVSYGTSCASEKPAVNTRVGSFIEFIISSTPGVDYCQAE